MHGANIAIGAFGRFACRLPEHRFFRHPDQSLQTHRKIHTDRSPFLGTAFRSPVTAAPLSASIPGSTFPACPFGSRLASTRPVRSFSSTTAAGSPQPRLLPRLKPVAGHPPVSTGLPKSPHSPPGLLPPSGSTRSAFVQLVDPPAGPARFPLAPRRRQSVKITAADHRSRIATFPERVQSTRTSLLSWDQP
jgi:hypothetical protein